MNKKTQHVIDELNEILEQTGCKFSEAVKILELAYACNTEEDTEDLEFENAVCFDDCIKAEKQVHILDKYVNEVGIDFNDGPAYWYKLDMDDITYIGIYANMFNFIEKNNLCEDDLVEHHSNCVRYCAAKFGVEAGDKIIVGIDYDNMIIKVKYC